MRSFPNRQEQSRAQMELPFEPVRRRQAANDDDVFAEEPRSLRALPATNSRGQIAIGGPLRFNQIKHVGNQRAHIGLTLADLDARCGPMDGYARGE